VVEGLAEFAPWPQRAQAPGKSFRGFGNSPPPPVKKLLLALGEKKLGPPSPLVAVFAQGFMIFREAGDQGFHCLEFGLDSADTREERGLRLGLGRCRCVRHGWMIARKGYRSANSLILRSSRVQAEVFNTHGQVFIGGIRRLLSASQRQLKKARGDLLTQRSAARSDLRRKTVANLLLMQNNHCV
jgi:hypothetical protein